MPHVSRAATSITVQKQTFYRYLSVLAVAVVILVTSPVSAGALEPRIYTPTGWYASVYPWNWRQGFKDGSGRFVHDFSYAGYKSGEQSIPETVTGAFVDVTAPPYSADSSGATDSTDAIQRALDDVGRAGGGTVYLPAGVYSIQPTEGAIAALRIRHDGVVLKGAGRGVTFVSNTSPFMRFKSVILASPQLAPPWTSPPYGPNLAASASNGSARVRVTDPNNFKTGDTVFVRTEATEPWLLSRWWPRGWNPSNMDATTFVRSVVAVEGSELVLDVPLRQPLNFTDRGQYRNVYAARPHLSGVGIEDLSLGMVQHPGTFGWGGEDYDTGGTSAYDVHDSRLILVRGAVDGWVRRIDTFAPNGNRESVHILSNGVRVMNSRSVTVSEVTIRNPQYRGSGGNGYAFDIKAADCLFERCVAIAARHSYSFAYYWTTGNVLRDCVTVDPLSATDFHAWYAAANLIDGMRLRGDMIDATYRSSGATKEHGATTSESTFWNTVGLAYGRTTMSSVVQSVQYGWGLVIGTSGSVKGVMSSHWLDGGYPDRTVDLVEGVGTGALLLPRSVSLDQYQTRHLGRGARNVVGDTLPAIEDATVESSHAWVNAGYGAHLYAVHRSTGARQTYLKFNISDQHRIRRARLVVYASSLDTKRRWTKLDVYGCSDTWNESSLTWRNKPYRSSRLASTNVRAGTPRKYALDVTEYVRGQQADGLVSFAILGSPTYAGRLARIMSRESSSVALLEIEVAPDPAVTYTVVSAPASVEGTATESMSDGSLSTGFAHVTHGGSVTLDLGWARDITGVGIAQHTGDRVSGLGEVQVSQNGSDFTCVRSYCTAGESRYVEPVLFESPVRARFVRLVGLGNTGSSAPFRSGYKELEVYGR